MQNREERDKNSEPSALWGLVVRHFYLLGLLGPVVTLGCAFIAATSYEDSRHRGYSPLLHWISSLGRGDLTPWAWVFNGGMIVGAIMLGCFIVWACLMSRSRAGYVVGAMGILATVGMGFVGVFPDGSETRTFHQIFAVAAFIGIFGVGASFSVFILIVKQNLLPQWLLFSSLMTVACSGFFIVIIVGKNMDFISSASLQWVGAGGRPIVRLIPLFEWLGFVSVLLWCFLTAWTLRFRNERPT